MMTWLLQILSSNLDVVSNGVELWLCLKVLKPYYRGSVGKVVFCMNFSQNGEVAMKMILPVGSSRFQRKTDHAFPSLIFFV